MRNLDVHVSSLKAGERPHPAHRHEDEELIIPLSGTIEVLRGDEGRHASETASPGQLVYHSSGAPHTIRAGEEDAFYLVFKWIGEETQGGGPPLEAAIYGYAKEDKGLQGQGPGFGFEPIFEAPTRFLSRLHAHVSRVEADAGYPDERDPYDIAMVLLSGSIVTQGGRVDAPAVIFHPADALHGVRGAGTEAARYLVLEFHGHAELKARQEGGAAVAGTATKRDSPLE
jgi:quercetin dioxygenase-like cupin family protein